MRKITLIRHGEASFDALNDHERSLTPKGEQQARLLNISLYNYWGNHLPELFIYSGAKRTEETVKLVMGQEYSSVALQLEPSIYEAPLKNYLQLINKLSVEVEHVVIVAHNPTLTELGEYLSEFYQPFMPSACVQYCAEIESWNMLSRGVFSVEETFLPKIY